MARGSGDCRLKQASTCTLRKAGTANEVIPAEHAPKKLVSADLGMNATELETAEFDSGAPSRLCRPRFVSKRFVR